MLPFFKEEVFDLRHQLTFVGDKLYIYIPSYYLDKTSATSTMASVIGENIETIGLFWFKTNNKFYELTLPLKFIFTYSEEESFSGKLRPELPDMKYSVFILHKGDAFCYDLNHRENIQDIMFFMNKLIENGKMPPTIKYSESLQVLLKALEATGSGGLGVGGFTYELLLSELYRNKHKMTDPYRLYLNEHPDKQYDYKMIRVTKIPELASSFTGLLGEDNAQQIVSAVVNGRLREKGEIGEESISPVEKLIKY